MSLAELGSFNIYLNFYGSVFEFLPNNYCSTYGLLLSLLKSCFIDYRFTWLCLSIIEFSNYGLWFFYTPNVSFINYGSIPFFLPISYSFFRDFSSISLSFVFLQFDNRSNGLFLFLLYFAYTLSIAVKSVNYKSTLYRYYYYNNYFCLFSNYLLCLSCYYNFFYSYFFLYSSYFYILFLSSSYYIFLCSSYFCIKYSSSSITLLLSVLFLPLFPIWV